jgi:flagellar basal-body rod protein FlgF
MNYGLYLSASGMLTNLHRQDVFANNLANVKTVGFKRDLAAIQQRDPEAIEERFGSRLSQRLLDRLGGGVFAARSRISLEPAPLEETGGDLDLALTGRNAFFAVRQLDAAGNEQVRLTRDGRLTRDAEGMLVTIAGGYRLLDDKDQPIALPATGKVHIDNAGKISVGDDQVATIQVAAVNDPERLIKQGHGLFQWRGAEDPRSPVAAANVRQGFVESSGVDPIKALMALIGATKAVTGNANLIRYHDAMMDRAVNVLGRVA